MWLGKAPLEALASFAQLRIDSRTFISADAFLPSVHLLAQAG